MERLACLALLAACATGGSVRPDAANALAPAGRLRAAINFGNPVLAQRDASSGEARGVSVDLARELARRLAVPLELVTYDSARQVVEGAKTEAWDVAFVAIDPERAGEIVFTAPYVVIEGTYAVPIDSPLRTIEDVDRDGVRVAVGAKSAYDLFLTRTLKHARLVRAPTSPAAIELFQRERLDAVAGVKQPLVELAKKDPSVRVIDGRFMSIEQAMGTPNSHRAGAGDLRRFVEEMKASGFVADALRRSGQTSAAVAPPANGAAAPPSGP